MSDLEERLREAIDSSVANAEPRFDVMRAVRRRHRRRLIRASTASAATVTALVVAAVFLGVPHGGSGRSRPAGTPTQSKGTKYSAPGFPGGGRLLFADRVGLKWVYSDGRTVRFARGFGGATLSGGELLAWKKTRHGEDYYTMRLDGSRQRLVLSAERNQQFGNFGALLSPDGSRLAYIRSQGNTVMTLWVLDLATGQRVDLGPVSVSSDGSGIAWRDDTTILAGSADHRALILANTVTRRRSTYLTVTDPALVRAYEQARPGAGPPSYIASDGWSGPGTSSHLAVRLTGSSPNPVEVVLAGRTPVASYTAPAPRPPGWQRAQEELRFTWGPNGLFLLQATVGEGMQYNTYAGTVQSDHLSRPIRSPDASAGVAFNPAGNVIALQESWQVTLMPTPRPACERTPKCLAFQAKYATVGGTLQDSYNLQDWVR